MTGVGDGVGLGVGGIVGVGAGVAVGLTVGASVGAFVGITSVSLEPDELVQPDIKINNNAMIKIENSGLLFMHYPPYRLYVSTVPYCEP
jgi:hypothetical protein